MADTYGTSLAIAKLKGKSATEVVQKQHSAAQCHDMNAGQALADTNV